MVKKQPYFKQLVLGSLSLLLLNFSPTLFAGEKENKIINKAIEAYGGDSLTKLESLKLTDNINNFSIWQTGDSTQGAMTTQLTEYQIELSIDLINKSKVFKRATTRLVGSHATDKPTVDHKLFVDGKGYVIDHGMQQYQSSKRVNYNNVDLGFSQMLDPMIIRQLDKDRNKAHWADTAYIEGQAHDVLTVHADTKQEYSLYLNKNNGYLTRMLKKQGKLIRSYDFIEHRQTQGITWAKQMLVSTAKLPIYHTKARQLVFNSVEKNQFDLPSGYKTRPKMQGVDMSTLTIRQLAKDVYFVGQGWGYTLFIDAGDHYISAGSWGEENNSPAWQQGLELLRKTTGDNKPIAQHLVSHHHTDHMSGLNDALKQGAKLLIHPTDMAAVQKHLPQPLADNQFVQIKETSFLADGKVMLFDVPNSHAKHNLVIYLPEDKLLFTEDMFGSSYQIEFNSPNGWPSVDTHHRLDVLTNKIKELGLEVDQYVSSHHARILNQAEIDKAMTLGRYTKEDLLKRLFYHNSTLK
jgi:glyoxylase-like metal-dependent hydrolase (beta-lactamase superfamily II)